MNAMIAVSVVAAVLAVSALYAASAQVSAPADACMGSASCFFGTVTKVVDGDTIDVGDIRVRLSLVNTPERGQPLFKEATAFVSSRCPVGLVVLVDEDDGQQGGSYGRMIGAVWCQGEMINAELAQSRYAVIDTRFCSGSEFSHLDWAVAGGCPGPVVAHEPEETVDDPADEADDVAQDDMSGTVSPEFDEAQDQDDVPGVAIPEPGDEARVSGQDDALDAIVPEPEAQVQDVPGTDSESGDAQISGQDDAPGVASPDPADEAQAPEQTEPGEMPADGPEGGGCLVATASYGSELAPQVQKLRQLRDSVVLETESGRQFMEAFYSVYYTFSPVVADAQRQNPYLNDAVRLAITPMIMSLSILEHLDAGSEAQMVLAGAVIISLNAAVYLGPIVGVVLAARRL